MSEEIQELQRRGLKVISGSVRRPDKAQDSSSNGNLGSPILCLQAVRVHTLLRSLFFAATHWQQVSILMVRVLFLGKESPNLRLRALLHTCLGVYYAVLLKKRAVDHIHVHHGYFSSWIAMVAARLLGIGFSLTLHGSDLLLHGAYIDTKLKYCRSCVTISDYNRRYIFDHFPAIDPKKVIVSRLGVDTLPAAKPLAKSCSNPAGRFQVAGGRPPPCSQGSRIPAARVCPTARYRDSTLNVLSPGRGRNGSVSNCSSAVIDCNDMSHCSVTWRGKIWKHFTGKRKWSFLPA